jgi:hypothetical protein
MSGDREIQPDIRWVVVEPGVIELPTTAYRITHHPESCMPFKVTWRGEWCTADITLESAKYGAFRHMQEMLAMGYEV